MEECFELNRFYKQKEVQAILGNMLGKNKPISSVTFNNQYRKSKKFPKPVVEKKTSKVWRGYQLQNWAKGY